MNTPHFCMQCGAALPPGAHFCEVCGSSTTPTTAYPAAPPSSSTVTEHFVSPPTPQKSGVNWVVGLGVVAIAGLGIFFLRDSSQWLKQIGLPQGSTPQTQPPAIAPDVKPITPTADQGVVGLDDFVGHWAAVEVEPGDNADVLVLYREGENIVADIEGDRLELSDLNGRVLSGYLWSPYEDLPTPVSAALNEDKQQVTFTVSPPQSEPMVAVARRVQAEVPIAPVATPISEVITGAIAIEQVTNLPDVAAWQEMVRVNAPQNTTHIVLVEERPTSYLIHVFETVNNSGESSHTSTYNWYEVNRQTGEISPMF